MSSLVGIHSLSKSYGSTKLFSDISLTITKKSRIGLIGPNGAGKSTLLKIIYGIEEQDSGSITKKNGLRIGYTSQFPEFPDIPLQELLIKELPNVPLIEAETRARILLSKARFKDTSICAKTLSGGWKKRFDIVRALMKAPDLLLLDEPTNHLDIEGILWLEDLLNRESFDFVVISHDRYFLENVCSSIIELNRTFAHGFFASSGNLSLFLERKEAFLQAEKERERSLKSKEQEEVEWLKRSPKARTTKSRSRIERAHALIHELRTLKERNKHERCSLDFTTTEKETQKLLTAKNLTKSYGDKLLFKGVELTLSPKSRLGIVGGNGTGKTTLLKILAKELSQDSGTIKYADNIKLLYFDQHREEINPTSTLKETLSPVGDFVTFRGRPIHVHGYAKRFLFPQERLSLQVKCLSGGEKARILLARLMLKEADILFLDEPTNDLDISTLEVFEESLKGFPGAVVLISHDRCLMDTICTQIVGLGKENEHALFSDFDQWERASVPKKEEVEKKEPSKDTKDQNEKIVVKKRLSFKEQKELEGMEERIISVENEIEKLQTELMHAQGSSAHSLYVLLGEKEHEKNSLYERWQHLLSL